MNRNLTALAGKESIGANNARHGLPTSWSSRIETEAGGLMSYGGSFLDVYRQVRVLAGKILKGCQSR
jgi:hypothetical protein